MYNDDPLRQPARATHTLLHSSRPRLLSCDTKLRGGDFHSAGPHEAKRRGPPRKGPQRKWRRAR